MNGYDYSQPGAYFVTICTHRRACIFGEVAGATVRLTEAGQITAADWSALPGHYSHLELDVFVVMPNHVHGILIVKERMLVGNNRDTGTVEIGFDRPSLEAGHANETATNATKSDDPRHVTLPQIVGGYISGVTRRINILNNTPGAVIWQRSYHERIIRDENEANRIREYVLTNPSQWTADVFYQP